jgi:hypothetical protein
MLFVTLCRLRPGMSLEGMRRRLEWTPPEGVHIVGEYWLPTSDPRVVFIADATDASAAFSGLFDWEDVFEMETYPAMTGDEGLELARKRASGMAAVV